MSDNLRELDEAVQKYVAATFDGARTGAWVLITHSQTLENPNVSNYRITTPEVQPIHVDAGLVKIAGLIVQDSWDGAFDDED